MVDEKMQECLARQAKQIRRHVIAMTQAAGSGHPGGSLSAAEIVSALFFAEMRIDPQNPAWPERDRFILSKGHAAPVLYAALAERGFFDVAELVNLRKTGHFLQGHPDMKKVPGVDMSTGSLGQGVSAAVGMALGLRLDGKDARVFALLGDGELQEGQVWEAAMAAGHYGLDNLTIFIDDNGLQIDGPVEQVMNCRPIEDKFRAFGWNVLTIDGHSLPAIMDALATAKATKGRPTCIVAQTVKGKGVSFMENQVGWHGNAPNAEQAATAMTELG
ncbi:transketolase [Heliophilum fasciatum]|uniref:Transketolase n=1 Tax=Heliophilum fasciatum TaxID=35700 RepID=A0A4R2RBT7_9FIRM|nr:transketolase [Heliophilum fasciatum]MCW2279225.1 transketolase [Heliophilum fasciatum]TCP60812.1 transketolase [Heliophilum fasciatum]